MLSSTPPPSTGEANSLYFPFIWASSYIFQTCNFLFL